MDTLCRPYHVGNTFRAGDLVPARMTAASYQQVKLTPHISSPNFGERNWISFKRSPELSGSPTLETGCQNHLQLDCQEY